jgi:hypothetical protein
VAIAALAGGECNSVLSLPSCVFVRQDLLYLHGPLVVAGGEAPTSSSKVGDTDCPVCTLSQRHCKLGPDSHQRFILARTSSCCLSNTSTRYHVSVK